MSGLLPVVTSTAGVTSQSGPSNAEAYGPQLPHATVHQVPPSRHLAPMTKMPVSELTEVAVRLGLNVTFDCISESGPPHHRFAFCLCIFFIQHRVQDAENKRTLVRSPVRFWTLLPTHNKIENPSHKTA